MCHEVFLPLANPLAPTLPPLVLWLTHTPTPTHTHKLKHYLFTISLTRFFFMGMAFSIMKGHLGVPSKKGEND